MMGGRLLPRILVLVMLLRVGVLQRVGWVLLMVVLLMLPTGDVRVRCDGADCCCWY